MSAVVTVPVRRGRVFQPYALILAGTATLWRQAVPAGTSAGAQSPYTLGTQFSVSRTAALNGVWWYSGSPATVLPTRCGIWDTGTRSLLAEDASPSWRLPSGSLAAAGQGWAYCDMAAAGVTLPPATPFVTSVFQPASGAAWWSTITGYWTTGAGSAGIASGILSAPAEAASVNGQGCLLASLWGFPGTDPGNGEVHYVDVQVS